MRTAWIAATLGFLLVLSGFQSPGFPQRTATVRFQDVTDQVLPYPIRPLAGLRDASWGFIAVGDYNGDGWDDLYINEMSMVHQFEGGAIMGRPNSGYLLRNAGGRFVDESSKLPVIDEDTEHRHVPVWCDYDGDGREDLLIGTGYDDEAPPGSQERLVGNLDVWLRNDGARFVDVSRSIVVENFDTRISKVNHGYTCADLDNNGFPDIILENRFTPEVYGASGQTPVFNVYMNYGNGRYREERESRGFRDMIARTSNIDPWGLTCYDFDRVRGTDCASSGGNLGRWILNKGNGFFDVNTGVYRPIADRQAYTNDNGWGDFDGDGRIDFADAALTRIISIALNNGSTTLNDGLRSAAQVDAGAKLRWRSMAIADFDNDGKDDIFVTVEASGPQTADGHVTKAPDQLFLNRWPNFVEVGKAAGVDGGECVGKIADFFGGIGEPYCTGGGGAAVIDFDRDGRLDLVVGYTPWFRGAVGIERIRVYRNITPNAGNWIGLIVQGRRALGAMVTFEACGKTHYRQVTPGTHHLAQNTRAVHVGLGSCTNRVLAKIEWSDGSVERTWLDRNRYYVVRRP